MYSKLSEGTGTLALLGAGTGTHWVPELAVSPERSEWVAKEGAAGTEGTYQYLIFLPRCEIYAIRLSGSEFTGVYGPLEYDEVLFSALPNFPYESQVECVAWVKDNFSDFVPCEGQYEECMLWI
jgi:hypothetical protein